MADLSDSRTQRVINEVRQQLALRGPCAMANLMAACAMQDVAVSSRPSSSASSTRPLNRYAMTATVSLERVVGEAQVDSCLRKAGAFLTRSQIRSCTAYIQTLRPATLSQFALVLRGRLSLRRAALIRQAFEVMDPSNSGKITRADIEAHFKPYMLPNVLTGQQSPDKARSLMLAAFVPVTTVNITFVEFLEFYRGISGVIVHDVDPVSPNAGFVTIMEEAWGIQEQLDEDLTIDTEYIESVADDIRSKLRHIGTALSLQQLSKSFYEFDLDGSGRVDLTEFGYSLQALGVCLSERVTQGLFDSFDSDHNGQISYREFIRALFRHENFEDDASFGAQFHYKSETQNVNEEVKSNVLSWEPKKPTKQVKKKHVYSNNSFQLMEDNFETHAQPIIPKAFNVFAEKKKVEAEEAKSKKKEEPKVQKPTIVMVFGGPLSGKHTLCQNLSNEFGFIHLNVALLLQREAEHVDTMNGALALSIRSYVAENKRIPPELTLKVIHKAIARLAAKDRWYFLLDGFPRSGWHVHEWYKQGCAKAYNMPLVLYLDCPEQIRYRRARMKKGMNERHRELQERMDFFSRITEPMVLGYYRRKMVRVDAAKDVGHVYREARHAIMPLLD